MFTCNKNQSKLRPVVHQWDDFYWCLDWLVITEDISVIHDNIKPFVKLLQRTA